MASQCIHQGLQSSLIWSRSGKENFSPWRRKGTLAPPPSSLHHFDQELRSRSEQPQLRPLPGRQRALQMPVKMLCSCWWFSLSWDLPSISQELRCPPETTPLCHGDIKPKCFWQVSQPNCHEGFLFFRNPPHNWMRCSPSRPLPCARTVWPHGGDPSLLQVTALCSAEMEQNDGGTPVLLLFVLRSGPDGSSPRSFQNLTLLPTDWMKSPIIS